MVLVVNEATAQPGPATTAAAPRPPSNNGGLLNEPLWIGGIILVAILSLLGLIMCIRKRYNSKLSACLKVRRNSLSMATGDHTNSKGFTHHIMNFARRLSSAATIGGLSSQLPDIQITDEEQPAQSSADGVLSVTTSYFPVSGLVDGSRLLAPDEITIECPPSPLPRLRISRSHSLRPYADSHSGMQRASSERCVPRGGAATPELRRRCRSVGEMRTSISPRLSVKRRHDGSAVEPPPSPPASCRLLASPARSAASMRATFARNRSFTMRDAPADEEEPVKVKEEPECPASSSVKSERRRHRRHRHRHERHCAHPDDPPRRRHHHRVPLREAGEQQAFAASMDSAWACPRGHVILTSPRHRLTATPPSLAAMDSHRPSFDSCCSSSIPWTSILSNSWTTGIHYHCGGSIVAPVCRSCGAIHDQYSLTSSSLGSGNQNLPSVASAASLCRQGQPRRRHRHRSRHQHRHCRHCRHQTPAQPEARPCACHTAPEQDDAERSPGRSLPRRHRRVHPSGLRTAFYLPNQAQSLDVPAEQTTLDSLQESGDPPPSTDSRRQMRNGENNANNPEASRLEPASNASVRQWMAGNPLVEDDDKPLPRSNSLERLSDPASIQTTRRISFIKSYSDDLTGRVRARHDSLDSGGHPSASASCLPSCGTAASSSVSAGSQGGTGPKLVRLDSGGQNSNFLMVPVTQQRTDFDTPMVRESGQLPPLPTLAADTFIYIEDWSNRSFDAHSAMTPVEFKKRRSVDAITQGHSIRRVSEHSHAPNPISDAKSDSLLFTENSASSSSSSSITSSLPTSVGNSRAAKSPLPALGERRASSDRRRSVANSVSSGEPPVTSRRPKFHLSDSAYQTKENSTDSRALQYPFRMTASTEKEDERRVDGPQQPLLNTTSVDTEPAPILTQDKNDDDKTSLDIASQLDLAARRLKLYQNRLETGEWTCLTSKRLPNGFQLMSRVSEDAESEESGLKMSQSALHDPNLPPKTHEEVLSQPQAASVCSEGNDSSIAMEIFTILRPMRDGTEEEMEVSV